VESVSLAAKIPGKESGTALLIIEGEEQEAGGCPEFITGNMN